MGRNNINNKTHDFEDLSKEVLSNPISIIENNFKIYSWDDKALIPLTLLPNQIEIINAYENKNYNIVIKDRNIGASSITAAYIAIKLVFSTSEHFIIVGGNQLVTQELLNDTRFFLNQLPKSILSAKNLLDNSSTRIKLNNGNYIQIMSISDLTRIPRSNSTTLIVDELNFNTQNKVDVIRKLKGIKNLTLIGSPDYFYNLSVDKFNTIYLHWYTDPRFNKDLIWEKELRKNSIERTKTRQTIIRDSNYNIIEVIEENPLNTMAYRLADTISKQSYSQNVIDGYYLKCLNSENTSSHRFPIDRNNGLRF